MLLFLTLYWARLFSQFFATLWISASWSLTFLKLTLAPCLLARTLVFYWTALESGESSETGTLIWVKVSSWKSTLFTKRFSGRTCWKYWS